MMSQHEEHRRAQLPKPDYHAPANGRFSADALHRNTHVAHSYQHAGPTHLPLYAPQSHTYAHQTAEDYHRNNGYYGGGVYLRSKSEPADSPASSSFPYPNMTDVTFAPSNASATSLFASSVLKGKLMTQDASGPSTAPFFVPSNKETVDEAPVFSPTAYSTGPSSIPILSSAVSATIFSPLPQYSTHAHTPLENCEWLEYAPAPFLGIVPPRTNNPSSHALSVPPQ
jgi:hypothetical protein